MSYKLEQLILLEGCLSFYQPLWNYNNELTNVEEMGEDGVNRIVKYKIKYENFINRINLILPEVNLDSTFIDIGCSIGFNSFEIYDKGGTVTGVDQEEFLGAPISNYLIDYYKLDRNRINFVSSEIQSYFDLNDTKYDYCICFFMLNHFFNPLICSRPNTVGIHDRWKEKLGDDVEFFTLKGRKIIKTIQQRCNTAFIQLRFDEASLREGSSYDIFVDYLINEIGFDDIQVLYSDKEYYGKPQVIYKCVNEVDK